jgi:cation diffusion facilitator family transporter
VAREVRAIQVAIATSILGIVVKTAVGAITGSMTMISSAVDSAGDLIVSGANLLVVRISDSAPDEEHNYGHAKIEGLGAMLEGGFIFAAAVFIVYEAIDRALGGAVAHDSVLGIVAMLPILAMTAGTVLYLRRIARETGSLVVKADALHYLTDVWVNVGVLIAFVLVALTGEPMIDTAISIAIALYMIVSSVRVVREGFDLVMDRSLDRATVERVTALLAACPTIDSFHDFKTRAGKIPHVDFHVVVAPEMTAQAVHDLYMDLRAQIRGVCGASTKVLMHADPAPAATRPA